MNTASTAFKRVYFLEILSPVLLRHRRSADIPTAVIGRLHVITCLKSVQCGAYKWNPDPCLITHFSIITASFSSTTTNTTSKMVCSASNCICAEKSTCSCGAQPALKCNCSKAATENKVPDAASACACGRRAKDSCTCGVKEDCVVREGETEIIG